MAKKSKPIKPPKGWPTPPFFMKDVASLKGGAGVLVLARSALAWIAVDFTPYSYVGDIVIHDRHTSLTSQRGKRFYPNPSCVNGRDPYDYETLLQVNKTLALEHGATPEAIRLISEHTHVTENEVHTMSDKLAKKNAPKGKAAAAKGGKKAAAPKTKAAASKKNESAGSEPDTRKITVLSKENPFREGSARAEAFDLMKKSKTVQDYKDSGGPTKYVNRWAGEGHIKLA